MILVTGGTGFVGSHLLYQLATTSSQPIRAIKRQSSSLEMVNSIFRYYTNNPEQLLSKIEWVNADLLDVDELEDAFVGVTHIYHTAALVSFNSKRAKEIIEVNQTGTANLINLSLKNRIEKFCFVSSIAALGSEPDGGQISETSDWIPSESHSTYSYSKFWAEMEVWRGVREGLNCVIVNPSVIIGIGNWTSGSSKFFPTVKKGLKYYGTGSIGFVSVTDVAKAMVLLMKSDISNERFVLNSENLSYKEFLTLIANALTVTAPKKPLTKTIGSLGWRVAKILALLTGKEPLITRQSIATSFKNSNYTSKKIEDQLQFKFRPINEVVNETAKQFIAESKLV